jgi:NAD(P)-dependent dehydrogenase (short-subunit alcohol dehydrogenase family)
MQGEKQMKNIWLVGGSGDIGEAFAHKFGGEHKWKVWLSSRNLSKLTNQQTKLGKKGISTDTIQLDVSKRETIRQGVEHIQAKISHLDVLMYNISPQARNGAHKMEDLLNHTAVGLYTFLYFLEKEKLLPEHIIIPTSSRAKDIHRVPPENFTAKQALFTFAKSFCYAHDKTYSILWLGKRGTESNWRWLHPAEMAEKAWESYVTRKEELLVGDLY